MTGARSPSLLPWLCVLHLLVGAPGCGNSNRFDLSAIEEWCYEDEKIHLIWCREEGVDLVKRGSSNHRMLHARIRYDEIRYAIPRGQRQRGSVLPEVVRGLSDDSSPGVQQKSRAELLGMIGVERPVFAFDTSALSPAQRSRADAWLATGRYLGSTVLLWKDEGSNETWVLGGTEENTGVLNTDTGFQASTPDPYWAYCWSPGEGLVVFALCADTPRISDFPSRVVLWDYRSNTRSEYALTPPDLNDDR